jgi:SPP1 gp7 family putative phage head morphogenesis protein
MAEIDALKAVPPKEALAYFTAKGFALAPSAGWQEMWQEAHATAFTVAQSAGFDILGDVHSALQRALAEGRTLAQFKAELTPLLQNKGWWGQDADGLQLGSPRRLKTIYDTNMRTARAAGRWAQVQRHKARRPYLRYVAIMDGRTRPEHQRWHGLVLPVDDPFWLTHYPPNGWGCRCFIQQLSERDLVRYGYSVSPSPDIQTRTWTNPKTGEVVDLPEGIDPGWSYNVGVAALDGHAAQALNIKLIAAPPELAAAASAASAEFVVPATERRVGDWIGRIGQGDNRAKGERHVVGYLSRSVVTALASRGIVPASGAITVGGGQIAHALRDSKAQATTRDGLRKAVTAEELKRLPSLLQHPEAILYDRANGNVLYVFSPPEANRGGKLIVEFNRSVKVKGSAGKRDHVQTNEFITAGIVDEADLRNQRAYDVIDGTL